MKLSATIIALVFCISVFAQKKDSLPPLTYTFTLEPGAFHFIDSIWRDVHGSIGYELKKSDADRKQLNLGSVIYYFESLAMKQDSIYRQKIEALNKPKK